MTGSEESAYGGPVPSPLGHALGGLIVAWGLAPNGVRRLGPAPLNVLICIVAGVLPDVDFAWGGHNQQTHSMGAAVMAGGIVFAVSRSPRLAVAAALSWASHVLFDWLGSDDTPPLGVMALWPISSEFYFAHAYFFQAISRRYWLDNFIPHNTWAVAKEAALLGPLAALLLWWKSRRKGNRPIVN